MRASCARAASPLAVRKDRARSAAARRGLRRAAELRTPRTRPRRPIDRISAERWVVRLGLGLRDRCLPGLSELFLRGAEEPAFATVDRPAADLDEHDGAVSNLRAPRRQRDLALARSNRDPFHHFPFPLDHCIMEVYWC